MITPFPPITIIIFVKTISLLSLLDQFESGEFVFERREWGGRGYKSRLHGGPQRWFPNQNASWVTTVLVDIVRTYVTSWRHSTTSHRQIDRRTDGRDLCATCDDRLAAPYRGSFPQTPLRNRLRPVSPLARFYTSDAASNATFTYCTAYVWLVCQCIHTSRA